MMTGGPIRKFTSGWAVALFAGRSAHWFVRSGVSAMAGPICGQPRAVVAALRDAGTFKHCKSCERLLSK